MLGESRNWSLFSRIIIFMITFLFARPPNAEQKERLLKAMRDYKSQPSTLNNKASGQQNGELPGTQ